MSAIAAAPPLLTAIGHDAPRIDAVAKVTGEAQFAGDLACTGWPMAGCCAARTPMPASPTSTRAVPKRFPV